MTDERETGTFLGAETVRVQVAAVDEHGGRDVATRWIRVRSLPRSAPGWLVPAVVTGLLFPVVLRYLTSVWEQRRGEAGDDAGETIESSRR